MHFDASHAKCYIIPCASKVSENFADTNKRLWDHAQGRAPKCVPHARLCKLESQKLESACAYHCELSQQRKPEPVTSRWPAAYVVFVSVPSWKCVTGPRLHQDDSLMWRKRFSMKGAMLISSAWKVRSWRLASIDQPSESMTVALCIEWLDEMPHLLLFIRCLASGSNSDLPSTALFLQDGVAMLCFIPYFENSSAMNLEMQHHHTIETLERLPDTTSSWGDNAV